MWGLLIQQKKIFHELQMYRKNVTEVEIIENATDALQVFDFTDALLVLHHHDHDHYYYVNVFLC